MIRLSLTEEQYDILMKALLRQAQRHRGTKDGNRYDQLCDFIEAQRPGEVEEGESSGRRRKKGVLVLDADNPDYGGPAYENENEDLEGEERRYWERRAASENMPARESHIEVLEDRLPEAVTVDGDYESHMEVLRASKGVPTDPLTGRWDASTKVQTLLFDKDHFTKAEAVRWARSHDFTAAKVDETENYWRVRQRPPGQYHKDTFRTIELRPGVKAVTGVLR